MRKLGVLDPYIIIIALWKFFPVYASNLYIKFLARGVLRTRTTKLKELKVNEQMHFFVLVG